MAVMCIHCMGLRGISCKIRLSPTAQGHCAFGRAKMALSMSLQKENIKVMVTNRLRYHSICVKVQKGIPVSKSSSCTGDCKKKLYAVFLTDSTISNGGRFGLGRTWEEDQTPLSLFYSSSIQCILLFFSLASFLWGWVVGAEIWKTGESREIPKHSEK